MQQKLKFIVTSYKRHLFNFKNGYMCKSIWLSNTILTGILTRTRTRWSTLNIPWAGIIYGDKMRGEIWWKLKLWKTVDKSRNITCTVQIALVLLKIRERRKICVIIITGAIQSPGSEWQLIIGAFSTSQLYKFIANRQSETTQLFIAWHSLPLNVF